jgi:hypothetical protein
MGEMQWSDAPALTNAAPIRPEDSEEPQGINDGEPEHDDVMIQSPSSL